MMTSVPHGQWTVMETKKRVLVLPSHHHQVTQCGTNNCTSFPHNSSHTVLFTVAYDDNKEPYLHIIKRYCYANLMQI